MHDVRENGAALLEMIPEGRSGRAGSIYDVATGPVAVLEAEK